MPKVINKKKRKFKITIIDPVYSVDTNKKLYIKDELVRKVQQVRDVLGKSIRINSGIRCIRHNGNIGSAETSSHIDGWAADLQTKGSAARYEMLAAVLPIFDRVGIAKNFIHVDVDTTKTAGVVWTYDKKS